MMEELYTASNNSFVRACASACDDRWKRCGGMTSRETKKPPLPTPLNPYAKGNAKQKSEEEDKF